MIPLTITSLSCLEVTYLLYYLITIIEKQLLILFKVVDIESFYSILTPLILIPTSSTCKSLLIAFIIII